MAERESIQKGHGSEAQCRIPRQLRKPYSFPAPLHIFPLPTFVPHDPISLFRLICAWAIQTIRPSSSHPKILYQGLFSAETHSVHVTDPKSMRDLWEQGFYGKGSLSRSEPNWLEREKKRRGVISHKTSEDVTKSRRDERQKMKWERARKEQEAVEMKLLEEQDISLGLRDFTEEKTNHIENAYLAPIGPRELLALPNSASDLPSLKRDLADLIPQNYKNVCPAPNGHSLTLSGPEPTKEPFEIGASNVSHKQPENTVKHAVDEMNPNGSIKNTGYPSIFADVDSNCHLSSTADTKQSKYQKSVRFSPNVEQTTFQRSKSPSLDQAASITKSADGAPLIRDQEHLQLTMEEAFFLSYGLGVLNVLDPLTKKTIPLSDLLYIFRKTSYYPTSELDPLCPDDPFMISYVVYHHFRSLGWVVRGGAKFSVNYLLYNRGPVFSHAEFAVVILPSYSDPYWVSDRDLRAYVTAKQNRNWSWLHCINRVNNQAKKTLVLVYVNIPRPLSGHERDALGIDGILRRYKVREMVLKRWLANRTRD